MKNTSTYKYIPEKVLKEYENKKKMLTVIGFCLTCFFGLSTVLAIADYEGLREGLIIYIGLLIPSAIILYKGIKIGKEIELAYRYDSIFSGDKNGIVTTDELKNLTGKSLKQIIDELENLFNKGYFINCTLQKDGEISVKINDAMDGEKGIGFQTVKCEKCGGYTRIRSGTHGRCQYCRSNIVAK